MKKILITLCLFIFSFMLVSCGAESGAGDYSGEMGNDGNNVVIETNRKIYYTGKITITTKKADEVSNRISNKVKEYNGYASSISYNDYEYSKTIVITYRIPTEKLNNFLDDVDKEKGVTSKSITSTDITTNYNKAAARLEVLKTSRAAYLKALAEATTQGEIIGINDKIEKIDTEILELTMTLESYDNLLDYSTITITYTTEKEPSFFGEYFEYVGDFFVGLGKTILYLLPPALTGGTITLIVLLIVRKVTKKREEEKENNK